MKKTRNLLFLILRNKTRCLRIMKISIFLLIAVFAHASANVYSQGGNKVTITEKGISLDNLLWKIQNETDFVFIYNPEDVSKYVNLDVNVSGEIEYVLKDVLKKTDLTFEKKHDVYVIKQKASTKNALQEKHIVVTGRVTDDQGQPIPGVNIIVVEYNTGSATDVDGYYQIKVPHGKGTLLFSFIGFEKQEIVVDGQTEINVQLKTEVSTIEGVVVTGMFVRKAESYTGSSVSVSSDDLMKMGNRNLLTSLRNFDPTLNIVENNEFGADPNRLPELQIRGNASLPNVDQIQDDTRSQLNTPLIIIDGFESTLRRLMDMDETEVESITILKDASATAIYGSSAANGVVVVQTKAPKAGKLRITYRGRLNVETPDLTSYDMLNAKEKLELERIVGLYDATIPADDYQLKKYYSAILNDVNSGVDTYWLSKPLQTGVGQNHSLRLEGGDNKFRYSGSVQYNNIKGVMKESGREVFNGNINLTYSYEKVRFTNNLTIGLSKGENSPYGSFSDYVKMNPYWRTHDDNGNVIKTLGVVSEPIENYGLRWSTMPVNPLYNATLGMYDYDNATNINNNFSIIWDMFKGLRFKGSLGLTKNIGQSHVFKPADHTDFASYTGEAFFRRGSYNYGIANANRVEGRLNLSYNRAFTEDHMLSAGFDYSISHIASDAYNFLAEGFPNERLDFISAGLQYAEGSTPSGSESLTRRVGVTSFVNYSYKDKYFTDLSFRMDGSSQFGSKKRFAPFWATGIGWNLHNEEFFQGIDFINRLKIRGSVGGTGSQNFSSYQALSTYRYYTNDRYLSMLGVDLMGLGNDNLEWQKNLQYNAGIEFFAMDNRIGINFDYYHRTTKGLISSIELPLANGFSSYVENIGEVENKGFEMRATYYLIKKANLYWSMTATAAQNKNKIVEISQALKDAQAELEANKTSDPNRFYRVGESTSAIYAVRSLGIDPANGKEIYVDRFGNRTYVWNGLDQIVGGDTEPKLRGSINSSLRYKEFNLNVSFGYRLGGQQYNYTLINKVENADYQYNVDSRVYEDRWQQPGDQAMFKGLLVTETTNNTTRFIQEENVLNCQNINLSYNLRSEYLKKNLGLSLLTLTGNVSDVFYLSTVKRERGTTYPFSHRFSLGLSAIF